MSNHQLSELVPLKQVRIHDGFWSKYIRLVREVVISYQWEALNDRIPGADPSYAVRNFRIAAGLEEGEFGGMLFQDSDVAKWIEAVAYSLETKPDAELERTVDEIVEVIAAAQMEDGYLNTFFQIKHPTDRWTNLFEAHEMYCAGHMMEAAAAYYRATGKRKLLDVMCRFADHIDTVFGPEPGKKQGYCGHQEIELALVKLYEATGNDKYLKLSKYFIDERGKAPGYFVKEWEERGKTTFWKDQDAFWSKMESPNLSYAQAHLPVREQKEAIGHSVRAVYMYTAMADLAARTGDESLLQACETLWDNMTTKQMYITGGIGSTHHGEAFTFDYDLPNDTVYAETCASIGLVFFAQRMLRMRADRKYADVMERALYNGIISGLALDGKHFFYVNPLEVWPKACSHNPDKHHVKPIRQAWFGCACCPPNIARLLSSLGEYIYTIQGDTVYTHLYIGGEADMQVGNNKVTLRQKTNYPWFGNIGLSVSAERESQFALALRIPGWCREATVRVNGQPVAWGDSEVDGYVVIRRTWKDGDTVDLDLAMPAQLIQAHPSVRGNAGKTAIQRGPLVYCLEETDNGELLAALSIQKDAEFIASFNDNAADGMIVLESEGFRDAGNAGTKDLYSPVSSAVIPIQIKAIPYCLWGNREPGEMQVWTRLR